MKYGITDIGTNTIRSVVYDESLKVFAQTVSESTILRNTENDCLTNSGIADLCECLNDAMSFFEKNAADRVNAFATSAMRDVKNYLSVRKIVKENCNMEIELLSEEEEALCDFASVMLQTKNESGAAADLGGGSCQLMLYGDRELLYHCSKKIGVKRMYNKFGELTSENETDVRDFVKMSFSNIDFTRSDTLFVMGGTSKKIKQLVKKIIKAAEFSTDTLSECLRLYYDKSSEYAELSTTEINKIPYGIIILEELCRLCGSGHISVLSGGVREGYVLRRILQK